jgi:peroxiredoxin
MKQFLMFVLAIALLSAAHLPPGYTITGTLPGLPNGSWLFLSEGSKETRIDSCQVKDGRFSMRGRITDTAMRMVLQVGSTLNYKGFWLQNTDITITSKNDSLKYAVVAGSPMQEEENQLQAFAGNNRERKLEWIRQHPQSLLAASQLRFLVHKMDKQTAAALYDNLDTAVKASSFGKAIKNYLEWNGSVAPGDKFADFEQPDTKGRPVKLSALKAKYTLLEFWSSGCGACIQGHPRLVNTYEQYKSKGFNVVGVSLDKNKKAWLNAVAKGKLPWENLSDLRGQENRAALMYNVTDLPTNFLIDDKGIVIGKDLHDEALDKKLQELLP